MSRRFQLAFLLVVLLVTAVTSSAWGQSRISWQLQGGGVLPLSAYIHGGFRLEEGLAEDPVSRLVDQYGHAGFEVGTTILLGQIEIRYLFHRLTWDREDVRCLGTGPVVEVRPGRFDDVLVSYECASGEPLETRPVESARDPVMLHVISAGYRYAFLGANGDLAPYLAFAPGLGISSYNDDLSDDSNVFGLNLSLGAGLDWMLSPRFSIGVEARYNLLLTPPPGDRQAVTNRAEARDANVAQAVINTFHYVTLAMGLHFNFR